MRMQTLTVEIDHLTRKLLSVGRAVTYDDARKMILEGCILVTKGVQPIKRIRSTRKVVADVERCVDAFPAKLLSVRPIIAAQEEPVGIVFNAIDPSLQEFIDALAKLNAVIAAKLL